MIALYINCLTISHRSQRLQKNPQMKSSNMISWSSNLEWVSITWNSTPQIFSSKQNSSLSVVKSFHQAYVNLSDCKKNHFIGFLASAFPTYIHYWRNRISFYWACEWCPLTAMLLLLDREYKSRSLICKE